MLILERCPVHPQQTGMFLQTGVLCSDLLCYAVGKFRRKTPENLPRRCNLAGFSDNVMEFTLRIASPLRVRTGEG